MGWWGRSPAGPNGSRAALYTAQERGITTPVRFLNRFTHVRARHRTVLVRSPVDLRGDALACPKGLRYGLEAGAGLKTVLARALKCPCHKIMHSATRPVNR